MGTGKERPRDWNGEVIWLLERIAGLLASQGPGTDSGDVPRGIATSDVFHYVRDSHTGVGPATEVTLQMPETTRMWHLFAMTYHRTAGSGTEVTPRVGQASGFAADGPDDRAAVGPQAVADGVNAVFCQMIPCRTDGDFRLYFRPGFDAGNDNAGTYQFWFVQGVETVESTP